MLGQGERYGRTRWRMLIWIAIAALLLTPLIAMQFTEEVQWTPFDFAMAGALLIGAMAIYEIASGRFADPKWRLVIGGTLGLLVLLLWAHGAVGIF